MNFFDSVSVLPNAVIVEPELDSLADTELQEESVQHFFTDFYTNNLTQ